MSTTISKLFFFCIIFNYFYFLFYFIIAYYLAFLYLLTAEYAIMVKKINGRDIHGFSL